MRNFTERELQKQNHDYMEKFRRETLLEKSFYHLTEDESAQDARGGRTARAADQEHPVDPPPPPQVAASSTSTRRSAATCPTAASPSS